MRKSRGKIEERLNKDQLPPQLIGILADAGAIGATAFRLEPNPPYTMASFAEGEQACEIDFEEWSGQEMLKYLASQVTDSKTKTGRFVVEYNGKRYAYHFTLDRMRGPKQADVTWT